MTRYPKGYDPTGHETIGSDILAVLESVRLADIVLGPTRTAAMRQVEKTQWYPIANLLEPLEFIASHLGESSLKKVGWGIFKLSHAEAFSREAHAVRDLAYGIDVLYHRANRGPAIGGWAVKAFTPGHAHIEKTTPHPCVVEEGLLEEALRMLNVPCSVDQEQCFRKGADSCLFKLTSAIKGPRWGT